MKVIFGGCWVLGNRVWRGYNKKEELAEIAKLAHVPVFKRGGVVSFCSRGEGWFLLFMLQIPLLHRTPSRVPPDWGRGDQGNAESRMNEKKLHHSTSFLSWFFRSILLNIPFIFCSLSGEYDLQSGEETWQYCCLSHLSLGWPSPADQDLEIILSQIPKKCNESYQSFMQCTDLPIRMVNIILACIKYTYTYIYQFIYAIYIYVFCVDVHQTVELGLLKATSGHCYMHTNSIITAKWLGEGVYFVMVPITF